MQFSTLTGFCIAPNSRLTATNVPNKFHTKNLSKTLKHTQTHAQTIAQRKPHSIHNGGAAAASHSFLTLFTPKQSVFSALSAYTRHSDAAAAGRRTLPSTQRRHTFHRRKWLTTRIREILRNLLGPFCLTPLHIEGHRCCLCGVLRAAACPWRGAAPPPWRSSPTSTPTECLAPRHTPSKTSVS